MVRIIVTDRNDSNAAIIEAYCTLAELNSGEVEAKAMAEERCNVANGSVAITTDTHQVFMYDEDSGEWGEL